MTTPLQRETVLVQLTAAFARNARILKAMRPDVEIVMPSTSTLSGHHRGTEAVGRFVEKLGQFGPGSRLASLAGRFASAIRQCLFPAVHKRWHLACDRGQDRRPGALRSAAIRLQRSRAHHGHRATS